jgi:putative ubiquitin-RnfH superfamily antitoxin RatB of RatAB toxin-antitoxin module
MAESEWIEVEVAYALPDKQEILTVRVPKGSTAEQAIQKSDILTHFPDIDMANSKIGIFSRPCKMDKELEAGDRIEIYRPLIIDPKEKRRRRAEVKAKKEQEELKAKDAD